MNNHEQTHKQLLEATVSRFSQLTDIAMLSQDTAQQLIESFAYYHVNVYLNPRAFPSTLILPESQDKPALVVYGSASQADVDTRTAEIPVSHSQSLVAEAYRQQESILANEVRQHPQYLALAELPDTQAKAVVPLLYQGEIIGVLDVHHTNPQYFDEKELRSLQFMANQLADSLIRAELFARNQNLLQDAHALALEHRHMERQRLLTEAAETLLGLTDLPQLWTRVSQAARQIVEADRSAVYLYIPETDTVLCPHAYGLSVEYVNFINQQFRQVPGRQLLESLEPIVVNDVETAVSSDTVRQHMLTEGFRTYAVFPLIDPEGQNKGALTLYRNQRQPFSEDDMAAGQTIAHMAAMAQNKIQLLTETRHNLLREQRLNQITQTISSATDLPSVLVNVVQMAAELVDADAGLLGLIIDRNTMTFYPYNVPNSINLRPAAKGRGLSWKIAEQGHSQIIHNYQAHEDAQEKWIKAGVTNYLGVPLQASEEVLGSLSLFNFGETHTPFTHRDRALAESVGQQAAIAIENIRMYAEAQQRAAALSAALNRQSELDKLKNQFIQSVSHELRTPLGIIYGHAELLESGSLGDLSQEQQQSMQIIIRRVHMLSNLVDDLTALLAAETQEFRREEIDPVLLIYSMLADYQMQAEEVGITLQADIQENLPPILGDPTHLRRVFDNLVSNAFKFTPEGGSVTMRMWQESNDVIMEVADTGEGIPRDKLGRIFERFYQVEGGSQRRHMGTGLGLALVKEIVEAHRGTVSVTSTVNEGTTFRIMLPGLES